MFLTKIKPEEERLARLTPAERREDELIKQAARLKRAKAERAKADAAPQQQHP